MMHGVLFRTGRPRLRGHGRRTSELQPPADAHKGAEALERIAKLDYSSDYEDEGYVLSSVDAIRDAHTPGALAYLLC